MVRELEKMAKLGLIEKILFEIKETIAFDAVLTHNLKNEKKARKNHDDYDEVAILFSLINYVIDKEFIESELLDAMSSTSIKAQVSATNNQILGISFITKKSEMGQPFLDLDFIA